MFVHMVIVITWEWPHNYKGVSAAQRGRIEIGFKQTANSNPLTNHCGREKNCFAHTMSKHTLLLAKPTKRWVRLECWMLRSWLPGWENSVVRVVREWSQSWWEPQAEPGLNLPAHSISQPSCQAQGVKAPLKAPNTSSGNYTDIH